MKYRIVLLFCDRDKNKLIRLNKKINKNIKPDIIFSDKEIPHITLASGNIEESNFNDVLNSVEKIVKESFRKNMKLIPEKFEFSLDGEWLFIGLKENLMLENFTINMRKSIESKMELSARRKTHVTIAKSKNLKENINVNKSLKIPKKLRILGVGIGFSGENGTLNSIEKIIKFNN